MRPTIRSISGRSPLRSATVNLKVRLTEALFPDRMSSIAENCKIAAQQGFVMERARKVDLSGLAIQVKEGDPITRKDVQ